MAARCANAPQQDKCKTETEARRFHPDEIAAREEEARADDYFSLRIDALEDEAGVWADEQAWLDECGGVRPIVCRRR